MDMTSRRFDSMSLRFAVSSPSSLRRASSRSSAGVSSLPSPIWRTYSFKGSSALGPESSTRSLGSGSSEGVCTSSSTASKRCSAAFPSTDALSVARLPRLRDDNSDEGSEPPRRSRWRSYKPRPPARRLRSCAPSDRTRRLAAHVRHSRLQPRPRVSRAADARRPGTARWHRRARRRRRRLCASGGRRRGDGREAPWRGERAAGRDRRAGDCLERPPPRPRFHEGASRDRGQQPPDPTRLRGRRAQRRSLQRRRAARALRDRAPRAGDDRRLGGDLRAYGAPSERRSCPLPDSRDDGRGLARRARAGHDLSGSWSGTPALDRPGAERALLRFDQTGAEDRRGRARAPTREESTSAGPRARDPRGPGRPEAALPTRPPLPRGRSGVPRALAARGDLVPLAARGARHRLALLVQRAVGTHLDAFLAQTLTDEELERGPGSPRDVEQSIDLPLGEQLVVAAPLLRPVGHLRQPAEAACDRSPLLDRSIEPLLALEHLEARFPERVRERAE